MNSLRLALRLLRREWRAAELRVAFGALVLAITGITVVGFFTDRIDRAMRLQAAELIAADLVLQAQQPIKRQWIDKAAALGLVSALTVEFPSVVLVNGKSRLVQLKAVSPGYPLRGTLEVAAMDRRSTPAHSAPARGTVYADPILIRELQLTPGVFLGLGKARLALQGNLQYEPDRGGAIFNFAPRVLMHLDDLSHTGLIVTGSRASYRLLLAGSPEAISHYAAWTRTRHEDGAQLIDLESGRPELRTALARAEQFLGLAILATIILAGLAIAMAARRYAARQLDTSALLRCLGASSAQLLGLYLIQLLVLALVAGILGILAGFVMQQGLAKIAEGLLTQQLPLPGLRPAITAFGIALIMLGGFALPPIVQLHHVPPMRILQRNLAPPSTGTFLGIFSALALSTLLALWLSRDVTLGLYVLSGTLLAILLLALVSTLLILLASSLASARADFSWHFGIHNLIRRRAMTVSQIMAAGLGICIMLLLGIVREDLLSTWQSQLPADTPNHFVINIQSHEADEVHQFLIAHGKLNPTLYPMVRARLTHINGNPLDPKQLANDHARRLALRDQNLTWAAQPQKDNVIIAGHWWQPADQGKPLLSIEIGLARNLGLGLGDTVGFSIAGETLTARITNLRRVSWDSFNVNFFLVLPPQTLSDFPVSYVTNFYLPPEKADLATRLVKRFPGLTVLDIDAIMNKVRNVITRVSLAIEFVFGFTLIAGLIVLWTAISITHHERMHQNAVLRALGANRRQLLGANLVEFGLLGLLVGIIGAASASLIASVLASQVFKLSYSMNPIVWSTGLAAGLILVIGIGLVGTARTLSSAPADSLRRI